MRNVPARVEQRGDPWAPMVDNPQSLEPFLVLHERETEAEGLLDAPWPPVYPKMPGEPPRASLPSRARAQPQPADDPPPGSPDDR